MKFLIVMSLLFCMTGCMGRYHHRVKNIGNQMLYEVEIQCEDRSFGHGYVPPGLHKSYSGSFKISKGDKVMITWKLDENGKIRYKKEIYLDKNPGFKGVVFRLDGKDVTVDYEPLP